MINKHQKKNTIILAFVISVCLVITLYSLGFIHMLKKMVNMTTPSSTPTPVKAEAIEESKINE